MRVGSIAVFAIAFCTLSSAQTTRNVPGQYPTIQSAINVCVNGDNVLVAPGVYPGAINFVGKAINVHSSGGAAVTTIVGTPSSAVVSFVTGEGALSVLDGFTISGGNGGIFIQNASPVIQNCVIQNNSATSTGGGGVRITANGTSVASPSLVNCVIQSNAATPNTQGGGIECDGSSSATSFPVINGCLIQSNVATYGAGISFTGGNFSPSLVSCVVRDNSASNSPAGALVSAIAASIVGCQFVNNHSAAGDGGAITTSGSITLTGCLISDNSCGGNGGGVLSVLNNGQTGVIQSCTIAGNSGSMTGGVHAAGWGQLTVVDSVLWGNSGLNINSTVGTVTYSDVGFGVYNVGVGTISADPRFVDPANGDYHLAADSPCRDNGAPNPTGIPATDLDGTPRIVNGVVDMGVDEVPLLAFPGTSEDVELYAWVNGSGDPLASSRPAPAGSLLRVLFKSPNGNLAGANPVAGGLLYTTGNTIPQVPGFPGIWLNGNVFIILGTLNAPPFSVPGLPSAGLAFENLVPPGLSGKTLRLQALVTTPFAANGMYAVTNATEITLP